MAFQEDFKIKITYVIAGSLFFIVMLVALIEDNLAKEPTLIEFTGSVTRGERFKKTLPNALIFYLEPTRWYDDEGGAWMIDVGSSSGSKARYATVVNFPVRGPNMLQIEGWHFRNTDNTGPNDDGSINAPQYNRGFWFVETEQYYQIADVSMRCASFADCEDFLNRENIASNDSDNALDINVNVPVRYGSLTVTKLELGNLEPGSQAWIEYMEFDVVLNFELICSGLPRSCSTIDLND